MQLAIKKKMPEIKSLLLQHGVEKAFLFGSAARGEMKRGSDVDFVVKFYDNNDFEAYSNN